MNRALALSAIVLLPPAVLAAPAAVPADKVVESLIADLGAEEYEVRERATELLRRVGDATIPALERAAESDDPEIRIRARDVLGDVRLGLGPDAPAEIVLQMRHIDRQPDHQRYQVFQRIKSALGSKATPFLVRRMAVGTDREANYAFRTLQQMNDEEVWRQVVALVPQPQNNHQARALAWARSQSGQILPFLQALARTRLEGLPADEPRDTALADIRAKLQAGKAREAADAAAALAKQAPDDTRPLYLQADALVALNQDNDALELRKKALELSPANELPHVVAAAFLDGLGQRRLAVREWQRVLDIEPADSPADLVALLALTAGHADSGLFEQAAQYLEKTTDLFAKAKEGDEGGIDASVVESIQMEINRLRQMANQYPTPDAAAIEDDLDPGELAAAIELVVKGGEPEDLKKALDACGAQFHIRVEPSELKLFPELSSALRYDKARKQLQLLLHDVPACDPFAFDAGGRKAQVALHTADGTYIYDVDPAAGEAERNARFEKDYLLKLKPGLKLGACTDVALRLNGGRQDWKKALDGLPLDLLPARLDVHLEATTPAGKRITARFTLPVQPPKL